MEGGVADIRECDAVLAAFTTPDDGTAMEAWSVRSLARRVVVSTGGAPPHPWTAYVADAIRGELEDGVAALADDEVAERSASSAFAAASYPILERSARGRGKDEALDFRGRRVGGHGRTRRGGSGRRCAGHPGDGGRAGGGSDESHLPSQGIGDSSVREDARHSAGAPVARAPRRRHHSRAARRLSPHRLESEIGWRAGVDDLDGRGRAAGG